MNRLRVVTVAGDAERETALAGSLAQRPDVDLVMRCVDRVETLAVVRGGDVDALVVVGSPHWIDHELIDEATRSSVRIVVVGGDALGSDERRFVIVLDASASVSEIVRRCSDLGGQAPPPPPPSAQPSAPKGKVIALWGPKGAPGRTTLSLELANELAAADPSTLLIDADPYGGDLLQVTNVIEDLPTIVWAAQLAGKQRLDAGRLVTSLRRIGDRGPILLPGLPRGDLWEEVSAYGWRQLLGVARSLFGYTVCDVGFCLEADEAPYSTRLGERNLMTRATIQMADRVVAVCRADPVGLKNLIWSFDSLRSLVEDDRIVIVANRVPPGEERDIADLLRRQLGKRPLAYIPVLDNERRRARKDLGAGLRTLAATLGAPVKAQGLLATLSGKA